MCGGKVFSPNFHKVLADTLSKEEGVKVRITRIAIVTTVLVFAPLISNSSAFADNKTPDSKSQKNVDLKAAYKIAFDQFRKDFKIYEDQRREINRIYKEAIDKALSDARSAKLTNQTQIQKRQSMNARQNAVIDATLDRDSAIEALGSPPLPPTQPGKMPSAAKNKSPKTEKPPAPKN